MSTGKTIALVSPKGGSGKTITSVGLSKVFSYFGVKTLLIDGDAATNGLTLFNVEKIRELKKAGTDTHVGLFDDAGNSDQPDLNLIESDDGNAFLPATYSMIQTENVEVEVYRKTLDVITKKYRDYYPAIIIDAQAGAD